MKELLNKKLLIGVTAKNGKGWKRKLKEIKKHNIQEFALFIEEIPLKKRQKLYKTLSKLKIKEIPLVHIKDDTTKEELKFFKEKFNTKYFTIHEDHFKVLTSWEGFTKDLYLEFDADNKIASNVLVKKIGGFCVDLSHFKKAEERWAKEFEYILKKRGIKHYFGCNHLNGYSYKKNSDVHRVRDVSQFAYLFTLPNFVFGKIIALEMYNSIKQQLKYKEYLIPLLNKKFKE